MVATSTKKKNGRKLTVEERKAINSLKPACNKYMEAFRKNRGSFIVYDPAYML